MVIAVRSFPVRMTPLVALRTARGASSAHLFFKVCGFSRRQRLSAVDLPNRFALRLLGEKSPSSTGNRHNGPLGSV
jgi:hypothetical protein